MPAICHLLKSKMRKRRQEHDDEEQGHPTPTEGGEDTDANGNGGDHRLLGNGNPLPSQHPPQHSRHLPEEEKPSKRRCEHRFRFRSRPAVLLVRVISVAVIGALVYASIRGYYALELYLDDPFLEARLITPWNYLAVRYLQSPPSGPPRKFRMNANTTLVINLDRDVERYRTFRRVNAVRLDKANGPQNNSTHYMMNDSRKGESTSASRRIRGNHQSLGPIMPAIIS